jgi:uncharacterized membrane protein YccF (DUF307 family)
LKTLLNIIWLALAGVWMALGYLVAAVLLAITIIGLPFAKQSLKLGGYALWPFGRALVQSPTRHRSLSVIGNVLWFVLAGWWLALGHLFTGIALCLTIIGIPLGIADIKMAGAALVPFGRQVVRASELNAGLIAAPSAHTTPNQ